MISNITVNQSSLVTLLKDCWFHVNFYVFHSMQWVFYMAIDTCKDGMLDPKQLTDGTGNCFGRGDDSDWQLFTFRAGLK